jgi:hypothetical protein
MKKLLVLLALSAITGYSATLSFVSGSVTNKSLLTSGIGIHALTLANTSTNTIQVFLVDTPTAFHTNVVGAYTNYTLWATNFTNTVIASSGVTNSYIYTNVMRSLTNTVAAAMYNYTVVGSFAIPAGETLYVPYAAPLNTYFGLCVTNSDACTYTINYSPQK